MKKIGMIIFAFFPIHLCTANITPTPSFKVKTILKKPWAILKTEAGKSCVSLSIVLRLSIPTMTLTGLFIGASSPASRWMGLRIGALGPIGHFIAIPFERLGSQLITSGERDLQSGTITP